LFGVLGFGSEVKNLGVVGVNITGSLRVGGLVGWNRSGTVTQCYSMGVISGDSPVGGLVGYNSHLDSHLARCYSTGTVKGTGKRIGGLVGVNEGARVTHCYSTGAVGSTGQWSSVGGLVGPTRAL